MVFPYFHSHLFLPSSAFRLHTGGAVWDTRAPIQHAELSLDPARRRVIVDGRRINCSKQEFELLYDLAGAPGIVFSREELLARHWPHANGGDVRLVDPIISRLRRKIEREPASPRLILTVWGVGYKFAD